MSQQPERDEPADRAAAATPDSMQQVRELLFGEFQRRIDSQLEEVATEFERLGAAARDDRLQLEAELQKEVSALRVALEQRIEDLQTLVETEHRRIEQQLGEQAERLQHDKLGRARLARLMRSLADDLERGEG